VRYRDAVSGNERFVIRRRPTQRYEAIAANRLDRVDALYSALVLSLLLVTAAAYALIAATS
jgi:hypothetical protein